MQTSALPCTPSGPRRTADTYPNQMLEITVRMYVYRWRAPAELTDPSQPTFTQQSLNVSRRVYAMVGWRG